MKKKVLSVLLAASMALSLVACGNNNGAAANTGNYSSKNDTKVEDQGNADDADASDAGDETLTVWCWDPSFNINAMEKAEAIYQQEHPNFKLNVVETPWADVQTKLTTAATSGQLDTLPDIILMQDNAFQKNVISYPDAFADLTNTSIDFSQFASAKAGFSSVGGKNYGVPFDNGAVIACYRTDLLEAAGYTMDDFTDITWSQFIEKGKVVLEKTGKPLLSCVGGESDVIVMILQSAGGSFFDADGNVTITSNDALKATLETYKELVTSGVMIEVNDWDQYIGSLNNETVAGTINGCWIMASIQAAEDQSGNWAITNMPKLDDVASAVNYSNQGGSSWAVTSNCQNVDLAADFLGSTFGGSVEFWEQILPSGALSTYLPAAESAMYGEPSAFFSNESVFDKITEYAGKIPSCNTGVYFYEARDAVATAITNVINGSDIDAEIQQAEDTVNFAMGK